MARRNKNESVNGGSAGNETDSSGSATIGAGTTASIFPPDTIVIEPATVASGIDGSNTDGGGNAAGEPVRKRRGRKPGSTNAKKSAPLDINGLEFLLLSTHTMMAAMMKTPELELDKEEAHQLAQASANVARHYDISATEKTIDWIALFMALGTVYGPRMVTIGLSRKKKPDAAKANGAVSDMPLTASTFAGPQQIRQ